MGNKEQGRARTGGDVEEERVGGRGHVLPEEGEPKNTYRSGRHITELDILVVRQVEEIGQEEVETAMYKMKKARRQWQVK